jgi:hypothetical protein
VDKLSYVSSGLETGWVAHVDVLIKAGLPTNRLPWIGPAIGGAVIGFATLGIFVSSFNFLVDTYLFAAASALSANSTSREIALISE